MEGGKGIMEEVRELLADGLPRREVIDPKCGGDSNVEERRALLLPMLDAVYVDVKESKAIVAIQPKAPFRPDTISLEVSNATSSEAGTPRLASRMQIPKGS